MNTTSFLACEVPAQRKRPRSPQRSDTARNPNESPASKRAKLQPIITSSEFLSLGVEPSPTSLSSLFSGSETDSLYDGLDELAPDHVSIPDDATVSMRSGPPISGLFFNPSLLISQEMADLVMSFCLETYFTSSLSNQVMLFDRFLEGSTSGLPQILLDLLDSLSLVLKNQTSVDIYNLLFPTTPTMARQAIINLYQPGEGITPHVDLLGRYGDGIMGVSFGSGCTMRFDKQPMQESTPRYDVYLPERSVIVLSKEARYDWTHGIDKRKLDLVEVGNGGKEWTERGLRMSITFRWLLPGADVVGHDSDGP